MKILEAQPPSREQLPIIGQTRVGIEIIRGAAGSGKTLTAIMRLETLASMFEERLQRMELAGPVKILLLTFNRTLCGYVGAFAQRQASLGGNVQLEVDTFARWATGYLGKPQNIDGSALQAWLPKAPQKTQLDNDFLKNEIDYITGRFPLDGIDQYIDVERKGRGNVPQVNKQARAGILQTIADYQTHKATRGVLDWNDLAIQMAQRQALNYDIVIVDEAQDFSANELRAVLHHLSETHCLTLIIDTAQRLYPRGYTWAEVGLEGRKAAYHRLKENHRNTIEVAQFAKGIIDGVNLDEDATLPDLDAATRHGDKPRIIEGKYNPQLEYAINYILKNVDLTSESVAFLKPLGGDWFRNLRANLTARGLLFEDITRNPEWPDKTINIALSTMHSAKGLEFDHVFILGLNARVTPHGFDPEDDRLETLRRLLAMAIARARKTVHIGYKPEEASDLIQYFIPGTFELAEV